jgi:ankyrin repeat protein
MLQQLVAAGAKVEVVDACRHHLTPLHYAAKAGCSTLVAALLQAGADPGSTTPTGYTVLHAAASSRSLEVVQQVLGALGSSRAAGLVNAKGMADPEDTASAPLHLAAAEGHLEVVEALVAAGADKEQKDSDGATPLHQALLEHHCHLVPLLVTPGNANQRLGVHPFSSR